MLLFECDGPSFSRKDDYEIIIIIKIIIIIFVAFQSRHLNSKVDYGCAEEPQKCKSEIRTRTGKLGFPSVQENELILSQTRLYLS